ncbi:MAG TPA: DUF4395 family protein [Acidimicrobiia bacterium]
MSQPVEGVDARTDRVAQGTVGVALLAAFVFRIPWLVPGLSLLLAVGALAGPRANGLHRALERWVTPRLPAPSRTAPDDTVAVPTARAQDGLAAVILAVASLAFLLGIAIVGWVLALGEALIAIIAATTRIHLGDRLRRAL